MTSLWSSVVSRAAATAVDLWTDVLAICDNEEETSEVVSAMVDTAARIAEEFGAECCCEEDWLDVKDAVNAALDNVDF